MLIYINLHLYLKFKNNYFNHIPNKRTNNIFQMKYITNIFKNICKTLSKVFRTFSVPDSPYCLVH